jgi:hypothetical protein
MHKRYVKTNKCNASLTKSHPYLQFYNGNPLPMHLYGNPIPATPLSTYFINISVNLYTYLISIFYNN